MVGLKWVYSIWFLFQPKLNSNFGVVCLPLEAWMGEKSKLGLIHWIKKIKPIICYIVRG